MKKIYRMVWLYFWIVIYLLLVMYLTLRHVRGGDTEAYLVNSRKTRTLPLVFTTLATFVGGGTSIGLMAMGYESGFAAVGIGVAYVIGFFILFRFAGKINAEGSKKSIYSLPGYLNLHYTDSGHRRHARMFAAVVSGVNIFIFFFLLAAQFVGMASLLRYAFEIGYVPAAIISCLVVIFYTALAGLSGVILTDMIQFMIILIMIILLFIPGIWSDTNGLERLVELPATMLNGTHYGILFLVGLPLFLAPSVMVRMDIWQRMLAARNPATARRTSIISGLGMLPFYIIFPLVGMAVRLTITQDAAPRDVAYLFINRHSTEFVLGFAVVGLLAALMSSADSFLNIISISAVKDFVASGRGNNRSSGTVRRSIRLTTIAFGIIALIMALVFPRIVDLMVVGLGTIVIFVPVTVAALTHRSVHRWRMAALYSILSGFLVNLGFFIWGIAAPAQFEAKASFIPGFLVALIVLLVGMTIERRRQK
ncbi:MAG TPA: sodium:solute symporter family protein [Bacteroidales bacterium]|nr:sodium:solute symporter family protein [Bacteroidales bacterium]